MANVFYDPGARRAVMVQALFARIARRYDLINDLQSFGLHRRWKRRVVELARSRHGNRALDVCCGTGDLALGLAQRGVEVVGLDFSAPMLEGARRKWERLRAARIARGLATPPAPQFIQGDALNLPFDDNSFDIVTVGYGLRNLAEWEQGLSEMARVARGSGRLLVLDFGKPERALLRALYFGYLRLCVPLLGLVCCGSASAYAYILESLQHYPAQRGVEAQMRQLGLTGLRTVNLLGGVMSINYGEKSVPPAR